MPISDPRGRYVRRRAQGAAVEIAGSLFTRYGWVEAGIASARDWRLPLAIDAPHDARKPKRWLFPGSKPRQPSSFSEKAKSAGHYVNGGPVLVELRDVAIPLLVGVGAPLILRNND